MIVDAPIVGADLFRIRMPVQVDRLDGVGLQEGADRLLVLRAAVLPVGAAQSFPGSSEANLEGVGILDNEPLQPIRMAIEDAESDGSAIVLHVETEFREADLLEEFLSYLCRPVKGVWEILRIRHVRVTEARIVGGHDMELAGQRSH